MSADLAAAQGAADRFAEARLIPAILRRTRPKHKGNQNDGQTPIERFYRKVAFGASDCWYWWGHLDSDGYGAASIDGAMMHAHRHSWTLHVGPIPAGKYVLHRCDVRNCVNPDHLFLGDQFDNMRDMHAKKRWTANPYRGERHCNSRLTWAQVLEIRSTYANGGVTMAALGKQFGVSAGTVCRIVGGKRWTRQ